jgi:hypothetical protein
VTKRKDPADLLKRGRPSLYRPEYCERVVELGKKGYSFVQIADDLDLNSRSTLDDWAETNPEFSEALTRARVASQSWWERAAMDGLTADKFNALVWKTSMQARFREDYTERKVNEVVGKDGGAIQMETKTTTVDASALTADEREALRVALMAAKGKADGTGV